MTLDDDCPGSYAARAIASTEALLLYPKDSKKDRELRARHVEETWRTVSVMASLAEWQARQ
jgi:hypothetical protein